MAGLDGTFLGPRGLSFSPRMTADLIHPDLLEAQQIVFGATLAHGFIARIHFVKARTAESDCQEAFPDGHRFIALGTDILVSENSVPALHNKVHGISQ